MKETRHGLESNPVPTSIFAPKRAMMAIKLKMDEGTGLDSRPCLISIIIYALTIGRYVPSCIVHIYVPDLYMLSYITPSTDQKRCMVQVTL